MHLLTNATQAIEGKGEVRIRTFIEGDCVNIQISDTGKGIPCEKLQHLFDPDFVETGSRVKAGLGLFTSYNIMQKHRGEITVESKFGKGSTFMIAFPMDLDKQSAVTDGINRTDKLDQNRASRCAELSRTDESQSVKAAKKSGSRCDRLSHN